MTKDWTIDTCIFYEIEKANLEAIGFLCGVVSRKEKVALDHEGRISSEYRHCLSKARNDITKKLLVEMTAKSVVLLSGRLSNDHRKALAFLGFHDDDWPFVGVCSRTSSKDLVTHDSDYTDEVRKYLLAQMQIRVCGVHDARQPAP